MPVLTEQPKRTAGGMAPPRAPALDYGGDGNEGESAFPISSGYLGIWVLLTAVTMLFAGLTSAYIVLRGVPTWQNITMPSMVWVNTVILVASSVAIEFARKAVKRDDTKTTRMWLAISGIMGFAFLAGQIVVWRQLVAAGVYLATTLHSSFFYVLTGAHGVHLAGGLIGLLVVLRRAYTSRLTASDHEPLRIWAVYWHYMDVVWLYLFLLLLLA